MRACYKCGESLVVNEELRVMECSGGIHIEPINLRTPQWWATCFKNDGGCGRQCLAYRKQMPKWQKKVGNKGVFNDEGEGGKPARVIWVINPKQEQITCPSCGRKFLTNGSG